MKTKIIVTISRYNGTPEILAKMLEAGANVFRVNMSHCTHAQADDLLESILDAEKISGIKAMIMIDLAGPEVRLLGLTKPLDCSGDCIIELSKDGVHVSLPGWEKQLTHGMSVLLQDGKFKGKVIVVDNTIRISLSGQGQLLPNAHVSLPEIEYPHDFVSHKDVSDLQYALKIKADYLAVSFVQNAENIRYYRELIEQSSDKKKPEIVAKFESRQSLNCIDEIIEEGDCFFVARGDMGVENPLELIPYYQKLILKKCNNAGKEGFVATQMLSSMSNNLLPTRAEVTDIANAVLDGASGVTLSDESAIGKYPVESVKMMKTIAEKAEEYKDEILGLV
ncbi:MAG: pyruvate kinase [Candidatus Zophobacter franzmannii]|nr:pyruvate kinase [Candidatus Zophobacter franzmannii]